MSCYVFSLRPFVGPFQPEVQGLGGYRPGQLGSWMHPGAIAILGEIAEAATYRNKWYIWGLKDFL